MTAIEQKELRGISLKSLIAIVVSTATMVASFFIGIGKINHRIDEVNHSLDKYVSMNEQRIKTIEIRLDALELMLQDLKYNKSAKENEIK